ncbi:MAG: MATE family efflux transporter [Lachnospiraceae bacterium]|nr:MATE family efflux transporter [Lachnospiraceae bacterium]
MSDSREINENTPLMRLAGPMFTEMMLNILIQNIDTLMLSHCSEIAVGAVGNANQIMSLLILMFGIIATATSVVVAQYLGAKRYEMMNTIYSLVMVVNLLFGMTLSAFIVILRRPAMTLLNVSPQMMGDATDYIMIVGGFLFLQACYNVMLQILRCNGYTKVGMYISLAMNVINIVGNYLFLYGSLSFLGLGVKGVAISTVFARIVALASAVVVFYRFRVGELHLKLLRPFPGKMLVKMIKIGLPSAGESMSYNMYQLVLLSFINSIGNEAVIARSYCTPIMSFANVFSNSSAMATQIITGHLVGALKYDAAQKRVFKTFRVSMPVTIALSTANWLLSPLTLRIFTDNKAIIAIAFGIMGANVFVDIGRCMNMTFVCSLKASGDYIFPLLVGILTMWGLGVTVGYTAGIIAGLGAMGVIFGTASDECIRGFILLHRWWSGKWKGRSIVEQK